MNTNKETRTHNEIEKGQRISYLEQRKKHLETEIAHIEHAIVLGRLQDARQLPELEQQLANINLELRDYNHLVIN